MHKRKNFISKAVITILVFVFIGIILLQPSENFADKPNYKHNSLAELQSAKIQEITNQAMKGNQNYINLNLSEDEINEALYLANKEGLSPQELHCKVLNEKVVLYADYQLLNLIPTQVSITLIPQISDNSVVCFIQKASLGRIPISTGLLINYLKSNESIKYNESKGYFVLVSDLPSQLVLSKLDIVNKSVNIKVNFSIKSVKDLLQLMDSLSKFK